MWDMPVSGCQFAEWRVREYPDDPLGRESVIDMRVLVDVLVVVVVDEAVPQRLAEDHRHGHQQETANRPHQQATVPQRSGRGARLRRPSFFGPRPML